MTNQYALGYKAGLEAAVKVCKLYAKDSQWSAEYVIEAVSKAIAALPIEGEEK